MSELMLKIFQGLVRVLLIPVINWLVGHQIITADDTTNLVVEVTGWLAVGFWVVVAYVKAHRKTLTALTMPMGSTLAALDAKMASGAIPPITTGKTETPEAVKPEVKQ